MNRYLATLATFAVLAFATAQDTPLVELFAMSAANEMNGIMTDCPVQLDDEQACFRHELGVAWARMDWESLVQSYSDLEWFVPWVQADDGHEHMSRIIRKTSAPEGFYAVLLAPWGDYHALVVVVKMDLE